jgi:hypothetical protein
LQAAATAVQHRDAIAQADALQQLCASNAADRAEASAIMHRLQAELQEARAAAHGSAAGAGATGRHDAGDLVPIEDLIEARAQAARARSELLTSTEHQGCSSKALEAEVRHVVNCTEIIPTSLSHCAAFSERAVFFNAHVTCASSVICCLAPAMSVCMVQT